MWNVFAGAFLVAFEYCNSQSLPAASDYLITSLPSFNGSEKIKFNQYGGYMPIGDVDETALFFWFVESQNDPKTDPVALWLNGGPGSSSVELGFWQEHGPFRLTPKGVEVNEYAWAWNKIASVIYLESPSGVGFSYSNKTTGYNCTDSKTAEINYRFLINFFKVFKNFTTQDFYLTGESYGGHYVPELAMKLIDNSNSLNMKGFLIGNPGINSDWYYNTNEYAFLTFLYTHALIPQPAYLKVYQECQWDEFLTNCTKDFTHPTQECSRAAKEAWRYIPTVWDAYDIYAPTCQRKLIDESANENPRYFGFEHHPGNSVSGSEFVKQYTPWLEHAKQKYGANTEYNPCMGDWTPSYMNQEDVLKAIHAYDHYSRKWPLTPLGWSYGSETQDIALLFPTFFEKRSDWKITVVSGDADSAVPFIGSQRWIECLGRSVVRDWFNWKWFDGFNDDVGGSVKVFDGITFQTVKGCGHTIPSYCPQQGFLFFQQYINGNFSS